MFIAFGFLLGTIAGSFIGALVWRGAQGMNMRGRSMCPSCRKILHPSELIPLISFFLLRRRCSGCATPIGWHYISIELLSGSAFAALFWVAYTEAYPIDIILTYSLFTLILLILFWYDLRFGVLPDSVTIPTCGFALLVNTWLHLQSFTTLLIGIAVGAGFFLLQYVFSKGKWIGGGDIRLGALMGAILGWQGLLLALIIAYLTGGVIAISLLAARQVTSKTQIPFGILLTPATFIVLLWGNRIFDWYWSLL